MIALCVLLFAATALAGISQPTPGLGVQTRDGRQAHVRFISQLANPGANINLNGVASNTYTTQPAAVSIKVGTTTVVLTDTVNQGTTTAYAEIDTGNNGQATVTLTFNTPTPQTVTCPTVINKNDRVTYVLTQSVSPATPISSGSCSVGSGFCTNGAFTPGSATITCNAVTESLASVGRTCPTVPVRFFNLHTGCPTLKYELSVTSGVSETLDLSKTIPTTFGTSSHEQLERSISRSIGGVPLISATTSSARFVDAFIDASGALTSVEKLETGFLNVVNLAYRENPVGTRDNNFVVVISQSATIAGQLSKVVHFQPISAAQSFSQWIEVPTGSYFLHVYDDGDSETAIFGDNTGASIVAPTATALVIGSSTTIAANDVKIFRITNNAATAPLLAASLQVNTVTLNNNPSTLPNIADTTRHVIWNNVLQNSLKLAAPDSECCNYVKDFDDNEEVFANPGGSFDTNTLVPDTLTGDFSVFQSSSVCTALGAPIVSDTVALTDSTGSSECADQGIFVFARPVTVTSQTCTSTSTGVSTCSAGVSGTATSTVFASTTGVPSDTNPTGTIDLSLTVPFCDCTVPATPCGATLDCAEEAAFAALTAAVAASTTTITSAVSSSTTSIQTTVQAVNQTFVTNIDDNNAGIDIALAAIASTNGTLHVQLGKVQTTQAEHTSSLSTLSRKVVREFNGLEDDIEDLADDLDEVASAVDA